MAAIPLLEERADSRSLADLDLDLDIQLTPVTGNGTTLEESATTSTMCWVTADCCSTGGGSPSTLDPVSMCLLC
ncbi:MULTISPECIES: hypothetical protein [Streptomyces violaceusniger group]|uniref:Lantibiotic n=2 Tax=Streptomyces rhizosphaericus TaxID=114699 RepID=A0ABN1PRY0_9ACTN|nr:MULTISPECIES: hypothetical protein [Streptomyces violaceusniger group]